MCKTAASILKRVQNVLNYALLETDMMQEQEQVLTDLQKILQKIHPGLKNYFQGPSPTIYQYEILAIHNLLYSIELEMQGDPSEEDREPFTGRNWQTERADILTKMHTTMKVLNQMALWG
jgi:hypothetical protein